MSRNPHYIPGVTRKYKCSRCEQWLNVNEFYRTKRANGEIGIRQPCKLCYSERRYNGQQKQNNNSYCYTKCKHDPEVCRELNKVLVDVGDHYEPAPLPCYAERGVINATTST